MSESGERTAGRDAVEALLERYIDHRVRHGVPPDLAELCGESPELREPLAEYVRTYEKLGSALAPPESLEPGSSLLHYRIVDKLGEGGMGAVYAAEDGKLGRRVALKVLSPEMAGNREWLQRFRREAKAVAALNHPNIVTLYSVEQADGFHFLTMELVEGTTLNRQMGKGGLPLEKIFDLAIPIADALAAAHERGVVHRDLKPANVMVTEDEQVKVLDFGLAKRARGPAAEGASEASTETLTREGRLLGTVPYMSPEQVQGQPVDAGSDIFSFGVLLYEMATGQRPFRGETPAEVISSILRDTPIAMTELNPELPARLERIVGHCLEKNPRRRWHSARDLATELRDLQRPLGGRRGDLEQQAASGKVAAGTASRRRSPRRRPLRVLSAVAAALLAATIAAVAWWRSERDAMPAAPIRTLAVLPLANQIGDPQQQWFVDGMTDQLVTTLSQVPALKITSRTSAMAYQDTKKPVREIARELGVDAVIEGSVMREGDQVRITIQLVDALNDRNIWSQQYDRRLRDILSLHSDVARAVVEEIAVTLDPGVTARLVRKEEVDEEAYLVYLRGRAHFAKWTEAGWEQAIRYYEEAISLAPDFGRAHAALAEVYTLLGFGLGVMPWRDAAAKGRVAAVRAIELDPTLAEAHTALAYVYMREWDWQASEARFRRAIELNPSYGRAHHFYAILLMQLRRLEEAMAEARKAADLQPDDPSAQCLIAGPLHIARRFREAIDLLEGVIEEHPDFGMAYSLVSQGYALTGRYDEAIVAAEKALELMGRDFVTPKLVLACVHAWSGQRTTALELLRELEARYSSSEEVPAAMIGAGYHCLDQEEKAFDWLERSYEQRDPALPIVASDPWIDDLRGHPRFQAMLEKMGLPVSPAADGSSS